eukprot:CAMPEP_0184721132 /NCGR_PEP_ID=MMETSP0314-20130426/16931_1 /TAXON_ID=38298 /ORGANISM="Rhodella maculata, Strain CCMP 736" /LENGTH=102 /DNA_ID=CAMNT_0027185421 /DNA_START=38 /DNA_END=343 /DNA_ORIENTATION=+
MVGGAQTVRQHQKRLPAPFRGDEEGNTGTPHILWGVPVDPTAPEPVSVADAERGRMRSPHGVKAAASLHGGRAEVTGGACCMGTGMARPGGGGRRLWRKKVG